MFWVRSQNFFNFTLANTDLKMLKMTMVQNRNWGKKIVRSISQEITVKFLKIRPNSCLKSVND